MKSFSSLVAQVIDIYNLNIIRDWSDFKGPQGQQSSSPALSLRRQHHFCSISSDYLF